MTLSNETRESFIAFDYCWNVEMKRALQRHREGEARVVPIIVRECDWTSAPFAGIQALPSGFGPAAELPTFTSAAHRTS